MEPEPAWGSKNVNNKPEEYSSSTEREARSIALEKAYVHDVYQQIASHFSDSRYRAWPKVKQFLLELEPGSVVCDVGCGNGKYLDINPSIYKLGIDRCSNLTGAAREKNHEVLISDNLNIPFRDDCFDAVVSVQVIHHFATTERRVAALKELARVLRIGGRLMVSVWAMEQRHRRFESQDVLVPWNRPMTSSSDDKTSSIERDLNSTTTTSDDDAATHYHAYTQTSDSDHSYPSCSGGCRKRGRHRGRSIDPTCPSSSQSSSDLSSPNESCYSFVRRALQKLAGTRRNRGGRRYPTNITGFLGLDLPVGDENGDHLGSMDEDVGDGMEFRNNIGNQPADNFMPIELRQLESTDFVELFQLKNEGRHRQRGLLFSDVLYPRRRRTLETTSEIQQSSGSIVAQPKSKSLSDLFGLIPVGYLRTQRKSTEDVDKEKCVPVDEAIDVIRSTSSLSGLLSSNDEIRFPDCVRHKAVQTESVESLDTAKEKQSGGSRPSSEIIGNFLNNSQFSAVTSSNSGSTPNLTLEFIETNGKKLRPVLVKQKQSISHGSPEDASTETGETGTLESRDNSVCWGEIKKSVRDLPELRLPNTLQVPPTSGRAGVALGSTFWKQSSLNEELIYSERLKEKEKLKQNIQKQCSLNEELIYKRRENTRWDQMKEAFLNSSNVKCLQLIKNGISNRFRGADSQTQCDTSCGTQSPSPTFQRQSTNQTSSIRNGIVRMLQNWKQGEDTETSPSPHGNFLGARRGSKESTVRRGLFPPFFLRRSSAGSLNVNKGKDFGDPNSSAKVLSPPHLKRRPSENEIFHENMGNGNGNKLIPGVRHVRKLSREEGSDSSKDSSFQSDTSVDSEDSFASVIFIPKAASMDAGNEGFVFNTETRANSTDSDRSPKSPGTRLSPPNHNLPKSPSPLASEILRRRSPEVSPTKINLYGTVNQKEVTKFIFDEATTKVLSTGPEFICSTKEELPLSSVTVSVVEPQEDTKVPINKIQEILQVPVPVVSQQKKKVERIEVLRKPGVLPKGNNKVTRQLVRRSLPKALAVELYNPETEDADTSDTSSSSPNSVSSVVSVVNEDNWPPNNTSIHQPERSLKESSEVIVETIEEDSEQGEEKLQVNPQESLAQNQVKCSVKEEVTKDQSTPNVNLNQGISTPVKESTTNIIKEQQHQGSKSFESKSSSASILEAAANVVSSFESLVSQSSPKARRKLTLAKLGSTSDWLSSLPSDVFTSSGTQHHQPPQLVKRTSMERRTAGEKLLLGDVKKYQPKGPDAKWPSSIMDDSPTQATKDSEQSMGEPMNSQATAELSAKLLEEMEERDSLFDSLENLSSSRQHPSRNPSIDSSVRMSSTCSCSIRGGESFESWSSAKSSLTNSSSTQQKPSLPSIIPLPQIHASKGSVSGPGSSGKIRNIGTSSKSSSQAGEDTENSAAENSTALTYHRYYHVFREGELDKLIEKYVQNLHIISSYYDHANWCIIAEKVQVWTI